MNTRRIQIITVAVAVFFALIVARLFYWQVVKGKELSAGARAQHVDSEILGGKRGNILASDSSWLAGTQVAWTLEVDKTKLDVSPSALAYQLSDILTSQSDDKSRKDEEARTKQLLDSTGTWLTVSKGLTEDQKKKVEDLDIKGLLLKAYYSRFYPEGSSSAQVLGFVGKNVEGNDIGYFGLEGYYDSSLGYRPGFVERESDLRGIPIPIALEREVGAFDGIDLVTTINKPLQLTVEKALTQGISRYGAKSGSVTIMEPSSGNILAMATVPTFDPGQYYMASDNEFRNSIISDSFEPGSIFKIIVMAAAIDAGVVTSDSKCDICSGPYTIDKYQIETWNQKYYPNSTMTDVIVHSDNVGMVFVGTKLGQDKFADYITKFGFGHLTGIDLQGEFTPQVKSAKQMSDIDLATMTFGQGIAVTPIQMLAGANVIANGGVYVRPRIVTTMKSGTWKYDTKTDPGVRVISSQSAQAVTDMMSAAVRSGESKWIQAKGFSVAGKTGTAQIPVAGHYDPEKTTASFVGFAPATKPRFIMLVTLVEPTSSPWASETAAPLWFDIARYLFRQLGIAPNLSYTGGTQ